MKIDPAILTGGALQSAWSDVYGKPGVFAELKVKLRFPRVSERRSALFNPDGTTKTDAECVAFYVGLVEDWQGLEDTAGQPVPFSEEALRGAFDLDAGLEGWIVREANDLTRFL